MDDLPEDVQKLLGIGPSSKEEKVETFETSTVAAVLRQLGWTTPMIKARQRDLELGFSWDWFNDLGLVEPRCGSTREFRFRFVDLVIKPNGHEIVEAFKVFRDVEPKAPCCLMFHVFDHGRWVATNLQTQEDSSIHVVTKGMTFNVLPFTEFFKNRWSETYE